MNQKDYWQPSSESSDLGQNPSKIQKGETKKGVQFGDQLNTEQKETLTLLVQEFRDVFNENPGCAKGMSHSIVTPEGQVV